MKTDVVFFSYLTHKWANPKSYMVKRSTLRFVMGAFGLNTTQMFEVEVIWVFLLIRYQAASH